MAGSFYLNRGFNHPPKYPVSQPLSVGEITPIRRELVVGGVPRSCDPAALPAEFEDQQVARNGFGRATDSKAGLQSRGLAANQFLSSRQRSGTAKQSQQVQRPFIETSFSQSLSTAKNLGAALPIVASQHSIRKTPSPASQLALFTFPWQTCVDLRCACRFGLQGETPLWMRSLTSRPNFEGTFPRQLSGHRYEGGEAGVAATLIRSVLILNF